jgi:hemerythrin superfamily protein
MDALSLLREDHRQVEKLFGRFEETTSRAHKTRNELVRKMIRELSAHAAIEEQFFYPLVRKAAAELDDTVLEALEEHHVVKWTLSELDGMDAADERFGPKVNVLIESVRHHVKEEERELFPAVKAAVSRDSLQEMGRLLEEAKATAPTRPHPRTPDEPPANLVVGPLAA